jgi:hypothetical protein
LPLRGVTHDKMGPGANAFQAEIQGVFAVSL